MHDSAIPRTSSNLEHKLHSPQCQHSIPIVFVELMASGAPYHLNIQSAKYLYLGATDDLRTRSNSNNCEF